MRTKARPRQPISRKEDRRTPSRRTSPRTGGVAGFGLWLAAAILTIAAYAPISRFGFVSLDDPQYVSANPIVGQGLTWTGFRWAFSGGHGFYWHPLTWLSHQLDVQLFGMDAGSHHVMNLVFHVVNSLLVFLAFVRMTGAAGRSAFVAGLFALHPLHVESVAWIAERKDVLSTFFALLSILAYVGYARRPRRTQMLVVMLLFACGLMAKPMVVMLPFVVLVLDFWPLKRLEAGGGPPAWWPLVKEKLPLFGLSVAAGAITVFEQRRAGAVVSLTALPFTDRLETAVLGYVAYARDMVWPNRLAVYYPLQSPGALAAVAALILLASAALGAWHSRRRAPYVLAGLSWFLGTLLPVIGIVQAGAISRADRFTYVPLIGLCVVAVWGSFDLAQSLRLPEPVLAAATMVVLIACASATRVQVGYWQSNLALWGRAVSVTRQNYWAEDRLGVALADAGQLDQAIAHYTAALAIWPDFAEAHNNLGTARVDQGKTEDAIHEFGAAVRANPSEPMFHYNLAVVLNTAGRTPDAIREVSEAVRLRPKDSSFARALAVIAGGPAK